MITVLSIIASWKLLEKAGEKGWKTLIPFYGTYTRFKKFYDKKLFWNVLIGYGITLVLALIALVSGCMRCNYGYCCSFMSYSYCSWNLGFFGVLAIICGIATLICHLTFGALLEWYTGKAFDAGTFHCLSMIFVSPFAIIALGLDSKFVYKGNKRPDCLGRKQEKK